MDIQLEKRKGLKPKHIGYILGIAALLFIGWKIAFTTSSAVYRTDKARVTITTATAGKFDDYITINGVVAPIATIYMDAYEGGRVSERLIEEGAMV